MNYAGQTLRLLIEKKETLEYFSEISLEKKINDVKKNLVITSA